MKDAARPGLTSTQSKKEPHPALPEVGEGKHSPHVLREPGEGAAERFLGGGFVVAAALIAGEAVAGALVDVDLDVRALLLDQLDVGHRDRPVLIAELQER